MIEKARFIIHYLYTGGFGVYNDSDYIAGTAGPYTNFVMADYFYAQQRYAIICKR